MDVIARPTSAQVWGWGLLSVAIISLSGLFGGVLWPIIDSHVYKRVMRVLIGLAFGCLTATSIFQLLPEGFQLKPEMCIDKSVVMWGSVWILYMVQVILKIVLHVRPNQRYSEKNTAPLQAENGSLGKRQDSTSFELSDLGSMYGSTDIKTIVSYSKTNYVSHNSLQAAVVEASKTAKPHGTTATVAYMVIFGDSVHNFIDGMSIGAGYSKDLSSGISISIAIACEEFPHELGDFAILLNAGMPLKKALLYNFLSACTSFAGLILGILIGELEANIYIFVFAGGLFLYVSLANLIDELNNMIDEELENGQLHALYALILQNIGIFTGFCVLYMITKYPIELS